MPYMNCHNCGSRDVQVALCDACKTSIDDLKDQLAWAASEILRQPKYHQCSLSGVKAMIAREAKAKENKTCTATPH